MHSALDGTIPHYVLSMCCRLSVRHNLFPTRRQTGSTHPPEKKTGADPPSQIPADRRRAKNLASAYQSITGGEPDKEESLRSSFSRSQHQPLECMPALPVDTLNPGRDETVLAFLASPLPLSPLRDLLLGSRCVLGVLVAFPRFAAAGDGKSHHLASSRRQWASRDATGQFGRSMI